MISRAKARSRRLARLRITALPIFFEQVKPTRTGDPGVSSGARRRACNRKPAAPCRRAEAARRKSGRLRRVSSWTGASPQTEKTAPSLSDTAGLDAVSEGDGGVCRACALSVLSCTRRRGSGGQALAAFGAPCVQDTLAPFRRHARTKAVAAGANQVRRLESAFRHSSTPHHGAQHKEKAPKGAPLYSRAAE